MSPLVQALLINAIVLFAVLHADLGSDRKISRSRILRPILMTAGIVPAFVQSMVTTGPGLALEVAGTVLGLLIGLLAAVLTRVYLSPRSGAPVSSAGWSYAVLWIVVIAARSAFSYGMQHWFGATVITWLGDRRISPEALTDALIFMAVAMMLTRTFLLASRAAALNRGTEMAWAARSAMTVEGRHPKA